jgi:TetR/AcrR family transcriptional repressor of mexJK operon
MIAATVAAPGRQSPKRHHILVAAREMFMEVGFERASCDAIAARANVSKATIYSHFQDKSALFVASFSEEADALRSEFLGCLSEPSGDLEASLLGVGEKLVSIALAPAFVSLYRHASAESARFPAIGQMLFDRGAAVVQEMLGAYLERWAERGDLAIDDARVAAIHFSLLCQGDLTLRAQLGILAYPAADQMRQEVQRGVRTFIRAYGC